MTSEEKQLLLRDLSARLPYGIKIQTPRGIYTIDAVSSEELFSISNDNKTLDDLTPHDGHYWLPIIDDYKPFLRPMSSMTEEEKKEFNDFICIDEDAWFKKENGYINQSKIMSDGIDWLNAHQFDYRGLIKLCLAIKAPKGMYD